MTNRKVQRAVRFALLAAGAAGAGIYASSAIAEEGELEQIVVTGSRIAQPSLESTSPVSIISSQDVSLTGTQSVENLVNRMPQAFATQGATISNGASGTATVNLRGLGESRTLVLINARRMAAGDPSFYAPDLNQIPTPLIERVEVLTGGASAVYGSDAVAGVVNFIMKDNFEGVQLNANTSLYAHRNDDPTVTDMVVAHGGWATAPRSVTGGDAHQLSVLMGSNFADGKGNATLFVGWQKRGSILQSQRDFSSCALGASGSSFYCGGSSTSYPGRFRRNNADGSATYGTMDPATGNLIPWDSSYQFNYGPLNYFQRPDERWNAAAFMHYDVNDNARAYGEFMFMNDHTRAQIAPSGLFAYLPLPVPCDGSNPLITSQWLNFACEGATTGMGNMMIARRNVEGGGRTDDLSHESSRFVVGVKGKLFDGGWNYDLSGTYSKVLLQETYYNDFSKTRIARALDIVADPATGNPVCQSVLDGTDPNCVPYDLWTVAGHGSAANPAGGPSAAAIAYLQIPLLQHGDTQLKTVDFNLSSDLGKYGVKTPWAKDGLALSFGFQYAEQNLSLVTDNAFQTNDGAGQGGPVIGLAGGYNNRDEYLEVRLPIAQEMPMADSLAVNGSYRHSQYSDPIATGTNTYGIGMDWAPIRDVMLRGSYQRAVRAPSIVELYKAQGLNLWSAAEAQYDPCGLGAAGGYTLEQCQNTGIGSHYGDPSLQSPAGQYNYIQGGSTSLQPETSTSYTFGLVLRPQFLEGFSATFDFFNIDVKNVISNVPPTITMTQCLLTGAANWCDKIHRNSLGDLWSLSDGYIKATNINIGELKTSGVDIDLRYNVRIGGKGSLDFSFVGTRLNKLDTTPIAGPASVGTYDCVGLYGATCGTPNPKWRHTFRATWMTPWNLDVSLAWRYFGGVTIDAENSNPLLNGYYDEITKTLKSQNYVDLAAIWRVNEKFMFNVGINNILDKAPPITSSSVAGAPYGNGNTYPQVYDALGRFVFAGVTAKF